MCCWERDTDHLVVCRQGGLPRLHQRNASRSYQVFIYGRCTIDSSLHTVELATDVRSVTVEFPGTWCALCRLKASPERRAIKW